MTFPGSVYRAEDAIDSIRYATVVAEGPTTMALYVDSSGNLRTGAWGLGAAWKSPGSPLWEDVAETVSLPADAHDNEGELHAIRLGLQHAELLVRAPWQEVVVFSDCGWAVERLGAYRAGDSKWGHEVLADICALAGRLQARGYPVSVHWIKAFEHEPSELPLWVGEPVGYGAPGHIWTNYVARRAAGLPPRRPWPIRRWLISQLQKRNARETRRDVQRNALYMAILNSDDPLPEWPWGRPDEQLY